MFIFRRDKPEKEDLLEELISDLIERANWHIDNYGFREARELLYNAQIMYRYKDYDKKIERAMSNSVQRFGARVLFLSL